MRPLIITVLLFMLVACSGQAAVTFDRPIGGSRIYSEVLYLHGQVSGIERFRLVIAHEANPPLIDTIIEAQGERWQAELLHHYTGPLIAVQAEARSLDANTDTSYGSAVFELAGLAERPPGSFAQITDTSVSGSSLSASGTISGVDQFSVRLLGPQGQELRTQSISLESRFYLDEIPWSLAFDLSGYSGSSTLQITVQQDDLGEILHQSSLTIE